MARYDALNYNRNRSEWRTGQASDLGGRWGRGYDRGYAGGGNMGYGSRTYVAGERGYDRGYVGRGYDRGMPRNGERGRGGRYAPQNRGYDPNAGGWAEYEDLNRQGYYGNWSPGGFGSGRVSGLNYGRPRYFTGFGSVNSGAVGARGYSPVWE